MTLKKYLGAGIKSFEYCKKTFEAQIQGFEGRDTLSRRRCVAGGLDLECAILRSRLASIRGTSGYLGV
jgi:hypothetical protein